MIRVLLALFACLLSGSAGAQAVPEVPSADIGLTATGVGALDSLLARYTAPDRFPALMLMVARHGKVGYWKAAGVRDLARGDALDRNDVFRIYSITKPITAVAIMMLWEEGKLGLDDPVQAYLPAFARLRVYDGAARTRAPKRPLTIRHLLTFSSGMTYGTLGLSAPVDSILASANLFAGASSLDDLIERLANLPLVGDPGDSLSYGFQTDVLGRIVEVASGLPLDQYFRDRIFLPLEMRETAFQFDLAQLRRYPTLYSVAAGRSPQVSDPGDATSNWARPLGQRAHTKFLSGGGGLVSTPADYFRFLQMLANRGELGGVRLLRQATVDTMVRARHSGGTPRIESVQGPGWATGFQVMVAPEIAAAVGGGHDGLYWMSGAANLFIWVDPASGIVGMVWAQALPYRAFPIFEETRGVVHSVIRD